MGKSKIRITSEDGLINSFDQVKNLIDPVVSFAVHEDHIEIDVVKVIPHFENDKSRRFDVLINSSNEGEPGVFYSYEERDEEGIWW